MSIMVRLTMFGPIRIRAGSAHFCPCDTPQLLTNDTPDPVPFQCATGARIFSTSLMQGELEQPGNAGGDFFLDDGGGFGNV